VELDENNNISSKLRGIYRRLASKEGLQGPEQSPASDRPRGEPSISPEAARAFIARYHHHWYQNIHLGHGIYTVGKESHHELAWAEFAKAVPKSLSGRSVLDVGTNAGYFALQTKLRSARHVVGTEFVPIYLEQAREISRIWGVDIEYHLMDAHDICKLDQVFDLVVFAGILYHLKNPFQVIEDLGRMCTDAILVETEFIPDDPRNCLIVNHGEPCQMTPRNRGFMKFIEGRELNNDPSNWWVPDTECVMGMLRTAGFVHISRPVVYHGCRLLLVASKKQDSILNLDAFGQ
jgi:tRNA (mo5U34)-methyltransferase